MKLEIAPRAVSEAERCARWWRENRPAARMLFEPYQGVSTGAF